ncbi:MAG: NAD+ synthase [Candidatus Bathyarchaeota archaeon]|nr:NAD+ synthase [Candidatus Bathyarchaeota archaeon]
MKLTPAVLDMDLNDVEKRLTRFIRQYVESTETTGIVLGLSGGVDSNTIAALSALAIGGERVLGLILPEKETYNPKDIEDAKLVAKKFGIKTQICDITPALEGFYRSIPSFDSNDKLCKGNIKARSRMIYLYYHANRFNKIVCGSSDKSESMMGYFTKWGDVAADISPIMDLYKTQVRKLAEHLGIPKELATKPATPALWPEQSAEGELGIKYEVLDLILFGLEHFMKSQEIAEELSLETAQVEKVKARWLAAEHKRRMPLTAKLEYRTVGADFRLPRSTY